MLVTLTKIKFQAQKIIYRLFENVCGEGSIYKEGSKNATIHKLTYNIWTYYKLVILKQQLF
jgi:hypothetical protein